MRSQLGPVNGRSREARGGDLASLKARPVPSMSEFPQVGETRHNREINVGTNW